MLERMNSASSIIVLATGGTIACTADESGTLVPTRHAADLVHGLSAPRPVRAVDYLQLDSSAMTPADLDRLVAAVDRLLAEPATAGIVVTHGTDSLEETAMAFACQLSSTKPVILTGAQRSADHAEPDGPGNLHLAVDTVDRHAHSGIGGAWVCFGTQTLPAAGVRKRHTSELDAFESLDGATALTQRFPLPVGALATAPVVTVAAFPGAGRELIDAACASGARGIVVAAMGAGNMSPAMGCGLRDALDNGVSVVISTRSPYGFVRLAYGGAGGGASLGAAGAIGAGPLRPSQARILLAACLAGGVDPAEVFHFEPSNLPAG